MTVELFPSSINLRMQHLSLSLADRLLKAVGFAASLLSHGGGGLSSSHEVSLLIGALGVELCLQVCVCWQALQPQVCDTFPHALCDMFH